MIKDKNVILAIGMLSLVIAILLGRYADPTPIISFLEGLFYGLSIVLIIFTLILARKNNALKLENSWLTKQSTCQQTHTDL